MKVRPDIKFYSLYALKNNYKKLQKSKEHIIISNYCFWEINNRMLDGINYEIYKPQTTIPNTLYRELYTAIDCNNSKYIDEIIFVGMPWELEEANKYFGDQMLVDGS